MKKIILLLFSLLLICITTSCEKSGKKDSNYICQYGRYVRDDCFYIASERGWGFTGECEDYYYYMRHSENANWEPLYSEIVGFDYEPGYEYYISVEVYEQVPPYIADKDWYTMVLMEINSKESKNSFE